MLWTHLFLITTEGWFTSNFLHMIKNLRKSLIKQYETWVNIITYISIDINTYFFKAYSRPCTLIAASTIPIHTFLFLVSCSPSFITGSLSSSLNRLIHHCLGRPLGFFCLVFILSSHVMFCLPLSRRVGWPSLSFCFWEFLLSLAHWTLLSALYWFIVHMQV